MKYLQILTLASIAAVSVVLIPNGLSESALAGTKRAAVNRKPAVEPRVYVEDASTKSGFMAFDYADQVATQAQHAPTLGERNAVSSH